MGGALWWGINGSVGWRPWERSIRRGAITLSVWRRGVRRGGSGVARGATLESRCDRHGGIRRRKIHMIFKGQRSALHVVWHVRWQLIAWRLGPNGASRIFDQNSG